MVCVDNEDQINDQRRNEMRKCRECGGEIKIMGMGFYGDTIEVVCQSCDEYYEVEPDGLGEGGLEMVEAQMIQEKNDA